MFIFAFLYVSMNLTLGIGAHKAHASAVTKQILVVLVMGVIVYFVLSLILAIKAETAWDSQDNLTTLVVAGLSLGNLAYSRYRGLGFLDPMIRGNYSLIFKSVPQLLLAYKISQYGGAGLGMTFIVVFHVMTLARLFQISQSIYEAGWDRNRIGLAISEVGNEISWTLVTIAKFSS